MSIHHLFALVSMISAMACGAGAPPAPLSPGGPAAVVEQPVLPPLVQPTPVGSWRGSYACSQGWTGLDLAVESSAGGGLVAEFRFYGLPGNPSVPSGRFRMRGRVGQDGRVDLFAAEADWIEQPTDYMVVGLVGHVSADDRRFAGAVTHGDGGPLSGCSTFSLLRQQEQ